jgi:hypothetical protein
LAKRSERRRIVLAACAWRASASGLTNFAELFFAIVKYRCRCSGCATCQKKNFTDRNRLSRRYAGAIVCYLADSLGRRRISDMLSALTIIRGKLTPVLRISGLNYSFQD